MWDYTRSGYWIEHNILKIFSEVSAQSNNGQISTFLLFKLSVILFDQRPELLNICYHDYFSEVFLMMEGKWMLLFVSLSKTNVRTDILIRKTIFGDILVSAIFRFGKKCTFSSLNVTYLYNSLILWDIISFTKGECAQKSSRKDSNFSPKSSVKKRKDRHSFGLSNSCLAFILFP